MLFTKKMIAKKTAEAIGKIFVKFAEILDTDIINCCTYEYRTNGGYEAMPYTTFDVQRSSTVTNVARLSIGIDPSPTSFNSSLGTPFGWPYTVTIRELAGIGVNLTGVKFDYYDLNDNFLNTLTRDDAYFNAYFKTHRVPAAGAISASLYQPPWANEIASTEWTVYGTDDNGHHIETTSRVYLRQNARKGMSVTLTPSPIVLQPGQGWPYTVTISEVNGVGLYITGINALFKDKNGIWQDWRSEGANYVRNMFGTDYIPGGSSISGAAAESYNPSFYSMSWVVVATDQSGRPVYGASWGFLQHEEESTQGNIRSIPIGSVPPPIALPALAQP